jgi:hypothetical protein
MVDLRACLKARFASGKVGIVSANRGDGLFAKIPLGGGAVAPIRHPHQIRQSGSGGFFHLLHDLGRIVGNRRPVHRCDLHQFSQLQLEVDALGDNGLGLRQSLHHRSLVARWVAGGH